jgi:hypothetical protein
VDTTEDAARHVDAFVTLFFETFSTFKGRAFHMSGERRVNHGIGALAHTRVLGLFRRVLRSKYCFLGIFQPAVEDGFKPVCG